MVLCLVEEPVEFTLPAENDRTILDEVFLFRSHSCIVDKLGNKLQEPGEVDACSITLLTFGVETIAGDSKSIRESISSCPAIGTSSISPALVALSKIYTIKRMDINTNFFKICSA